MKLKQLEGLLRGVLASYRDDFNHINPDTPIDFSIDLSSFKINPRKVAEERGVENAHKAEDKEIDTYYFRIVKSQFENEPRVIFATYREKDAFPTKLKAQEDLYLEAITHLMIGGIEYSEALFMLNQKETADEGIEAEHKQPT